MLVRVADGAAFPVPDGGLTIGRDPSCAVVLESMEVSRRHAVIAPGLFGYALTDMSANGVVVNGVKVDGSKVLGRGDVIRIAEAEFRFEAAAASYEPAPSLRSTVAVATPPRDLRTTQEPAVKTAAPVLLATLEIINEDARKGTRFRIERPLVHVGRGSHNDVVLADDSVSGSHASLERRDDGWHVVDARSRNGTYVDGERVTGERLLRGVAELRFGGVKMVFRPLSGR
jgi:pSer/pThr/pTyr-binding forkhead associated (FHA) protein